MEELTIEGIEAYGFDTQVIQENDIAIYKYTLPNGIVLDRIHSIDGKQVESICLDGFDDMLYITDFDQLDEVLQLSLEQAKAMYEDNNESFEDAYYELYPQ